MKLQRKLSALFKALLFLSIAIPVPYMASSLSAEARSREAYCHQRARQFSGYPRRPGRVVGDAIGGAIGGAIISGILGGNKRQRRKAARIGGALGGLGGIARNNNRAARAYRLEYRACMRGR